jgi:hypothetical protein
VAVGFARRDSEGGDKKTHHPKVRMKRESARLARVHPKDMAMDHFPRFDRDTSAMPLMPTRHDGALVIFLATQRERASRAKAQGPSIAALLDGLEVPQSAQPGQTHDLFA